MSIKTEMDKNLQWGWLTAWQALKNGFQSKMLKFGSGLCGIEKFDAKWTWYSDGIADIKICAATYIFIEE